MRAREIRAQCQGAAAALLRFLGPVPLEQQIGQIGVRVGIVGRTLEGFSESRLGFIEPVLFAHHDGQIVERLGIAGIQLQGAAIVGLRFLQHVLVLQRQGQVVIRLRVVGIKLGGASKADRCLVEFFLARQQDAQASVGIDKVWSLRHGSPPVYLGHGRLSEGKLVVQPLCLNEDRASRLARRVKEELIASQ